MGQRKVKPSEDAVILHEAINEVLDHIILVVNEEARGMPALVLCGERINARIETIKKRKVASV